MQKTKWGIDGILKALYNLFPDSPVKREYYKKITGSKVFPLLCYAIIRAHTERAKTTISKFPIIGQGG